MVPKSIAVIVLVVLTLLSAAGCATSVTQNHPDSKLNGFVTEYHTEFADATNKSQGTFVISQWEQKWINDTVVNVRYREEHNSSTEYYLSQTDDTIQRFATIADASEYMKNTCNGWSQTSEYASEYLESHVYNRSTGHLPSVFLYCSNFVNETHNAHGCSVFQLDDIVIYSAGTSLPADYSSYYNRLWEGSGMIVDRPFSKSTSVRGNDVYMGIIRNATQPQAVGITTVEELTKSQNESKQLYDQYIASRLNEGFTLRPDWVARLNASGYNEVWSGQNGAHEFTVMYRYFPPVQSWEVTTEAS